MRRAAAAVISAVAVAGVLALDGFSSAPAPAPLDGNIGLTGAQMRAAMINSAGLATAVLIKGSVGSKGQTVTLDLQLNQDSAKGTIVSSQADVPFVTVNGVSYIQFTSSMVTLAGENPDTMPGELLLGEWVPTTSQLGSSAAETIAGFTSLGAVADSMMTSGTDVITAEGTGTVDGRTVAQYKDVTSSGSESEFSLPVSGPALPIQETGLGADSGTVTFTWNHPTTVAAPPADEIYSGS